MVVVLNLFQHLGLSLRRGRKIVDPDLVSGHGSGDIANKFQIFLDDLIFRYQTSIN
jgi:hypothetical protein